MKFWLKYGIVTLVGWTMQCATKTGTFDFKLLNWLGKKVLKQVKVNFFCTGATTLGKKHGIE